jgi:hypothetical protein
MKQALLYTRDSKIQTDPEKYGQFAGQASQIPAVTPTQSANQFDKQAELQKYGIDMNTNLQKYGIDSGERQTMATLVNNLKQVEITTASGERVNMAGYANQLQIAREGYAAGIQQAMINGDVQKYITNATVQSNERIANIQAALGRYQTDAQVSTSLNQLLREETMFNAQLAENARQFNVNTQQYKDDRTENARQFDANADYTKWLTELQANTPGTANTSNTNSGYKPKRTLPQLNGEIQNGNLTPQVLNDYEYYYGTPYNNSSNNNANNINVFSFDDINQNSAKSYGVDDYGWKLLQALQKEADKKGGYLTEEEIYKIAVGTSDNNNTNLDQIKKVYKYLGLDPGMLNNVKDAGIFPWNWDWGVKEK